MKKIEGTLSSIIDMLIDGKEKQQLPDWLEKLKDIAMMLMIYWMRFNTKLCSLGCGITETLKPCLVHGKEK